MFRNVVQRTCTIPTCLFLSKSATMISRCSVLRNFKFWQICRHPFKNSKSRLPYSAVFTPTMCGVIAYSNTKPAINIQNQQTQKISSLQKTFNDYLRWSFISICNQAYVIIKTLVRVTQLTIRCSFLCVSFGPLLMVYPLTLCSDFLGNIWFNLLLKFIVFAGPTFIKLGQWASTRRDLFSPTFCDILGSLHHDAACHSWEHTTQTMQRVFGENWEEWCNIESQDPVHSGCIGQVYKGYVEMDMLQAISGNLSNSQSIDGRIKVAVKVLHPGIMESVDLDLTIMKCVARFLTLFPGVEWLSLPEIILEFELLMKKQIDLKIEAYNLDLFNELFSSDPTIKFPSPIWPLVHSEVLVETFEEGTPISHFTRWKSSFPKSSRLKRRLAKLGISAILKMVFINNFVHADLHPGNIIVQYESDHDKTDPGESNCLTEEGQDLNLDQVRLVFLDAGIIASLSERDLENLQKVFTAIVTNRGDTVGELFLDHATANKCKEPEEFKKAMATLVDNVHKLTLHLGKVKLESNFSSVFLAIMILEGLGRSLDPQLDIIKEARPILLSGVYNRSRSQPHRQTNQSH